MSPDLHPRLTLFFSVWAAVGPMVGLFIGYLLTARQQHKHWLRENRKAEFKELISAMVAPTVELLLFKEQQGPDLTKAMEAWRNAEKVAFKAMSDRVYIAADIRQIDLVGRYLAIDSSMLGKMDDFEDAAQRLDVLVHDVIKLAEKE